MLDFARTMDKDPRDGGSLVTAIDRHGDEVDKDYNDEIHTKLDAPHMTHLSKSLAMMRVRDTIRLFRLVSSPAPQGSRHQQSAITR